MTFVLKGIDDFRQPVVMIRFPFPSLDSASATFVVTKGDYFNWVQPDIAATNQNACYKKYVLLEKCKHKMDIWRLAIRNCLKLHRIIFGDIFRVFS